MKTLIVEDDFTSRLLLQGILGVYGPVHIAGNGREALEAFRMSLETGNHYNLVCMDIMLPKMDGQQALREIREMEESRGILSTEGVKILMVSALDDIKSKINAFSGLCDDYLVKPISKDHLLRVIHDMGLIA